MSIPLETYPEERSLDNSVVLFLKHFGAFIQFAIMTVLIIRPLASLHLHQHVNLFDWTMAGLIWLCFRLPACLGR